jgi:hypothetical protein
MVQGFGRNGHRERSHGNTRGGYQPKKPQGPAKWVHCDAAGTTEQQWRGSVDLVNSSQHSLATQTTMETGEVSTTRTNDANATSTIDTNSMLNEEPSSPLTIDSDYFSDIEIGIDDKKYKRFIMVARNDDEILGEEENDYEGLDEEVVSGLLGWTEIHHTRTFYGKSPRKNKMIQWTRELLRVKDLEHK